MTVYLGKNRVAWNNKETEIIKYVPEPTPTEWSPNEDWWDIETILESDAEVAQGKYICLLNNCDVSTEVRGLSSDGVKSFKTSDGATYTYADNTNQINATKYGSPTINGLVVNNFSSSNYYRSNVYCAFYATSYWTINMKITTGSNISTLQYFLNGGVNYRLSVGINSSGKFIWNLASASNSWNIVNGGTSSYTVSANTTYWIRVSWSGSLYKFEYSTDGTNYNTGMSVSSSTSVYTGTAYLYLGVNYTGSAVTQPFLGSIDFAGCSFTTDYSASYVWDGSYTAIIHAWDTTQDKPITNSEEKTRYIIFYSDNENLEAIIPNTSLYVIFNCNLTTGANLFYQCYFLEYFKFINNHNFYNVTSFYNFCYYCVSLVKLPEGLDTSNATNFNYFCYYCCSLKQLPSINTSNGTGFSYFCYYCYNLETIPTIDTSNGRGFNYYFAYCTSLEEITIDFRSVTAIVQYPVRNCYNLKKATITHCGNSTNLSYFLCYNYSLKEIVGTLDYSNCTSAQYLQSDFCLETVDIIIPSLANFSFSSVNNLSKESLTKLANNAPTVSGRTLSLGTKNIERAGASVISILTGKGWIVN